MRGGGVPGLLTRRRHLRDGIGGGFVVEEVVRGSTRGCGRGRGHWKWCLPFVGGRRRLGIGVGIRHRGSLVCLPADRRSRHVFPLRRRFLGGILLRLLCL